MTEYDYPDLYQNRPIIVAAFYFDREGSNPSKQLVSFGNQVAEWLGVEWLKFTAAFSREDLAIRNFYEYKRTRKRWGQLLALLETETIESFGLNSYQVMESEEVCVAALNVDFRDMFAKPNLCYLHLVPNISSMTCIEQIEKWLLPIVKLAVNTFDPFYGFVHIGDRGLNWYLYAGSAIDSSFPIEETENQDLLDSPEFLHTRVPRVFWGNLLGPGHIDMLGDVDELRAWELGCLEWQLYHDAQPTEEFRIQKGIPAAEPGKRADWPVQVHQLEGGHIFFNLSPNPLDWSPNVGIDGLIKPEYRRITKLFRVKGLIT